MNTKTGISIGKKWFLLLAVFSLISSTLAMPIVLATFSTSNANPWPTKNHVNPVEPKIAEFRAKGMTDAQITEELRKLGMGWDPKSGATGIIGKSPSPEELKGLPRTKSMPASSSSRSTIQKSVAFATPTWDYTGIGNYMYPGSMPIDDDETHTHYVTTHLGRPHPYYEWTEIGVAAWNTSAYVWYFTYDSDEQIDGSNWDFHGIKTNMNTADAYSIVLNGTYDSSFGGYWYDIYLNWNWKRNGHLIARGNEANDANEIFSDTGVFTENSGCKFHDNYLSNYYYSWVNWNQNIGYEVYDAPGYMDWDVWIDEERYDFESWTE
ncbi:MAG: hypothetical protein IAX21_01720 [Candidatus Bathyarchaeota archaeon]|nr:hypothetical protein [Candidatus Bathyarchaeum tardum]WGM90299.1 MAG: hypothetical protein NUK63_04050 [Candidatus Bathyarchaeum tardum]WNZ29614.1 MAG: hypothetical protein IAX21_01720 [Candidatus Bathyarchaeota archaeon]